MLGDVLDDAVGDEVPDRLPAAVPLPAVGRRDRQGRDLDHGHLVGRDGRQRLRVHLVAGTRAADELVGEPEQVVGGAPGEDVCERIGTGDEVELGARHPGLQVLQRVHGVRRTGPVDVHPRHVEPRVRGCGDDRHQVAVLGRGDHALGLLPRVPGRHEDDLVEVEPRLHLRRCDQVAVVDGIEGAAHHPDSASRPGHWMRHTATIRSARVRHRRRPERRGAPAG